MSQTRRPTTHRPPTVSTPTPAAHDAELLDEMDELLDEIDSVLEANALEITRAYRQRGGQ
jgi:ubiquitin-like protein Pup